MDVLDHLFNPGFKMKMDSVGGLIEDCMTDFLYGEWNEEKLRQYEVMARVPVLNDYMDYLLDRRADEEYLRRYGMDYSDIHDPRKLKQSSSGSRLVGSSLNFVSRNVSKLYR